MGHENVSENLVKILADMGIKQIFGVVGDALNSVTEAIRKDGRIQWIGVRHEEVAAFAAGAQAQITGGLGVCAGTVGPGALHLLNGLYDAKRSRAALLAITGQVPLDELGSDYFQEVPLQEVFRDVSVFSQTVVSPGQMPRLAHLAIQSALAKQGVSQICIPGDIGQAALPGDAQDGEFYQGSCEVAPVPTRLQEAADLINPATKVTLLVGIGCQGARSEVLELGKRLQAPMVYTLRAKDILEHDNPYAVGMTGLIGTPAGAAALESADVLLLVGTDFPYRDWYPKGKTIIQIDHAPERLGRRTKIDLGLVGSVGATLKALLPLLNEKTSTNHLNAVQKQRDHWREKQNKYFKTNADNPVHPQLVAHTLSELAADNAVFTADVGMCTVWAARYLQMKPQQRLLGSFNHGTMANAMPQALGVQALDKSRQVIALCGDGGLSMLMGDLITAVSYELPIKVVVFNNQRLGMVKLEMETDGFPEYGTILKNPNFAKVGEALGMTGFHVTHPKEVTDALQQALNTAGPVLVNVETNPNELSMPPKFLPKKALGFALGKAKEHFLKIEE